MTERIELEKLRACLSYVTNVTCEQLPADWEIALRMFGDSCKLVLVNPNNGKSYECVNDDGEKFAEELMSMLCQARRADGLDDSPIVDVVKFIPFDLKERGY